MALSIGKHLKHIRETQGISLETISQKTHISLAYLKAIEIDDEESLPSKVHLRGFLRLYASELGVPLEDLQVGDYHLVKEDLTTQSSDDVEIGEEVLAESSDAGEQEVKPAAIIEDDIEATSESEPAGLPIFEIDSETESNYAEPRSSKDLFSAIGKKLKQRRELLSLSIKDIHANIHIREEHLVAIEQGEFGQLPSPVQARGMLVNYAEYLNLDTDVILSEFADSLQLQRLEKQKEHPQKGKPSAKELSPAALRLKNFFSLDLLIITGLFLIFAIFAVWGVNRILSENTPEMIETEIPGVSDILLATDTPTPRFTIDSEAVEAVTEEEGAEEEGAEEEELPLFTPVSSAAAINIILVPRQQLWVQVTADFQVVFQGRLLPGNAYDFTGEAQIDILTGNAGALQIIFNDQDIGSLGLVGQVVSLSFTENGLVLPPATSTPTITETPEPTMTPTPGETNG
jgi:cytoskeleton protein RodZ